MAANTGIIDGGDLMLYAYIVSTWTLIGDAKSHSLSNKSEVRTRRTKATGDYPGRKVTGLDCTINTDCLATYGSYGYFELLALQIAKTKVLLKLAGHANSLLGVTEQIGDKYLQGTFVIDSVDINTAEGDDATFTASFSIDGALTISTVAA
jgi:hypothetical protein